MSSGLLVLRQILTSSLARSSGIYTASTIVNSAIPFLLLPILTRYLDPVGYGVLAMMAVLQGFVSPFVGLNIHGAVSVKYYEKDAVNLPRYIGNCFLLLVASSAATSAVLWFFAGPISRVAEFPREWLWAVMVLAIGQFVVLVLMTLWQVENRPVQYGFYQNGLTLLNFGLSVLLVVGIGRAWQGRIEAQVISMVVFAALGMYILYRKGQLDFSIERKYLANALRFGVPLVPHALGGVLMMQTDRLFIANMVGVADAGLYSVGFQIGFVIEILAASFNRAYVPWLYEKLKRNDQKEKVEIVKLTYCYFALITIAAIVLALVAPWFMSFFVGRDFTDSYKYTGWIALGFAFSGMYYMVANYIFYTEKTRILAIVTLVTAILNIALNYIFIKHNGAVGSAQASMTARFICFIFTWILSARVFPMPWKLKAKQA